jgi:hypothetical protein
MFVIVASWQGKGADQNRDQFIPFQRLGGNGGAESCR